MQFAPSEKIAPPEETVTAMDKLSPTLAPAPPTKKDEPPLSLSTEYQWAMDTPPPLASSPVPKSSPSIALRKQIERTESKKGAPKPSSSPPVELTEAEVREWLETYRQAWEGKNVDQLVSLGVLTPQDADGLRRAVSAYKDFRVTLTDLDIQREGTRATVTFRRVDTVDGRTVSDSKRTSLTFEKKADGRIVMSILPRD